MTSVGEGAEEPEPTHIATVENSLAVPQKVRRRVTSCPSNSIPRYITERTENICPHKNVYMSVHSSIIHISQRVETAQMPLRGGMDTQYVLHPCSGMLFTINRLKF